MSARYNFALCDLGCEVGIAADAFEEYGTDEYLNEAIKIWHKADELLERLSTGETLVPECLIDAALDLRKIIDEAMNGEPSRFIVKFRKSGRTMPCEFHGKNHRQLARLSSRQTRRVSSLPPRRTTRRSSHGITPAAAEPSRNVKSSGSTIPSSTIDLTPSDDEEQAPSVAQSPTQISRATFLKDKVGLPTCYRPREPVGTSPNKSAASRDWNAYERYDSAEEKKKAKENEAREMKDIEDDEEPSQKQRHGRAEQAIRKVRASDTEPIQPPKGNVNAGPPSRSAQLSRDTPKRKRGPKVEYQLFSTTGDGFVGYDEWLEAQKTSDPAQQAAERKAKQRDARAQRAAARASLAAQQEDGDDAVSVDDSESEREDAKITADELASLQKGMMEATKLALVAAEREIEDSDDDSLKG